MSFDLILMIIFVSCFCFILFQCMEFIQNYDYICKFNKKYKMYEFLASPSFNYVDKSYFDPNDTETNPNKKWRCVFENNKWYGISEKGLILDNTNYSEWDEKYNCIDFIFGNPILNFNNPCKDSTDNEYCNIYKKYFN